MKVLYAKGIPEKKWTHVAVTVDRTLRKVAVQIDTREITSTTYDVNTTFNGPTSNVYMIGGGSLGRQLFGEVMDLYVLDQALTEEQLRRVRGLY